jgi:hypothetical protein
MESIEAWWTHTANYLISYTKKLYQLSGNKDKKLNTDNKKI